MIINLKCGIHIFVHKLTVLWIQFMMNDNSLFLVVPSAVIFQMTLCNTRKRRWGVLQRLSLKEQTNVKVQRCLGPEVFFTGGLVIQDVVHLRYNGQ